MSERLPPMPPPPRRPLPGWVVPTVAAAAALVIGYAAGASPRDRGEPAATTTPGPPETVTVERATQECLDALDRADELLALGGEAMGYMADGLGATADRDVATMREVTSDVDALGPVVADARDAYGLAAAECRRWSS